MQTTSPIRRYLLLRHRGQDTAAPGWSVVRLAPATRRPGSILAAEQEAKRVARRDR